MLNLYKRSTQQNSYTCKCKTIIYLYIIVCKCTWVHEPWQVCRGQRTSWWNHFTPPTLMWGGPRDKTQITRPGQEVTSPIELSCRIKYSNHLLLNIECCGKDAQCIRTVTTKLATWIWSQERTWWKERTNTCNLSCDLHNVWWHKCILFLIN